MSAFIKENIKNGFVLEEEHLAKINDICKKRLSEKDADAQLKYKVYRVDGLVYETTDYSDIIKEENSKRNKIEKITIQHAGGITDFSLSFDEKEAIDIAIETDSKDFAYLLYSDVKDYIVTEVAKHRKFMFKDAIEFRNLFPFLMLPIMAWFFYIIAQNQIGQDAFNTILSGSDVNQKLNHLMEAGRAQRDTGDAWKSIIPLFIIGIFIRVSGPILDSVYPINIFCWGKAETDYKRIISIRVKVIWGILIGFIISAVASFFVYYVTK